MIAKVLIVDDNLANRKLIRAIVTKLKLNIEIIEAEDGQKALIAIEENYITLVILDIMMPKLDGVEVLRTLQSNSKIKDLQVIICSAVDDIGSIEEALALGAIDYFTKPLTEEQIRIMLPLKIKNALLLSEQRNQLIGSLELSKKQVEQRLFTLFDNMGEGVAFHEIIYDGDIPIDYIIVEVNRQFEEITGISRDECVGKNATKVYKTEKSPFIEEFEYVVRHKTPMRIEKYFEPMKKHFSISITAWGENGFTTIFTDITKRKESELLLKKLWKAVEQSSTTIVITGTDGKIEYVNPKFSELTGYMTDEALGSNPKVLKSGVHTEEYYRNIWDTISNGQDWKGEFINKKKNGEIFCEFASISPIRDEFGNITNFVAVKEDITERKNLEKKQKDLLVLLEQKNKEMEEVIYAASHDLRSPLVNIQGFSQRLETYCNEIQSMLEDIEVDEDTRSRINIISNEKIPKSLNYISASAKKMNMLIEGLLRLSRTGRAVFSPTCVDMNSLIKSIADSMEFSFQTIGGQIEFVVLPDCYADVSYISQVFSNLIDNAIKYRSSDRKLKIKVSGERLIDKVRYTITDNGKGIAVEEQSDIWKLFHRLEPDSYIKGEGLGLTLAKRIVERSGGQISIESQAGEGCSFFVSLPIAKQN